MVFFTTAELLEIGGLPFVTPYEKPTRIEALRYYRRVADTYALRVSFDEKILAVEPQDGRFTVRTQRAEWRSPREGRSSSRVATATRKGRAARVRRRVSPRRSPGERPRVCSATQGC